MHRRQIVAQTVLQLLLQQKNKRYLFKERVIKMIIGLTGLHGAGKSYVGKLLEEMFEWEHFEKRTYLQAIFKNDQKINSSLRWTEWHRELHLKNGSFKIMKEILGKKILMQKVLIIDSVHNTEEWRAIKDADSRSILVGVFSPSLIRETRRDKEEGSLDKKRIIYWHESNDNNVVCLLSEVEWAFSGMLPRNLLISQFNLLHHHLIETKRII